MKVEVCVDNIESIHTAQKYGADRIELCGALALGGITPNYGLIERALAAAQIPLYVMIRPRAGDFLFSVDEVGMMQSDIRLAKKCGAQGVVIGALTEKADIDIATCQRLIDCADGLGVTFHRAFDLCRDPQTALEQIIELGCERLLTSGQQQSAVAGVDLIRDLVRQADQRISIMPGAGVNASNARQILQISGAQELHLSAGGYRHSAMLVNEAPSMGKDSRQDQQINITDGKKLQAVLAAIKH
ncbi:copper homeostasis protein CutC [Testudinibacter sp. TR-2022]|uniref:copper homeostasis protein CutC n=1 Tax=Testudinibacter sp. TR-2022 TaxID=2585029 RepID=UPI00111802D5|nr:copper homeostasis protein CutC [Testudinibacter sp. TR-2022]TNH04299.1 copper homeostasis protein CutC [Pasteurellaceae bacterium Phil31]TNH07712.1 copper homeostasis protein CutC [Testudinibacter sp. TR-2022]TNH10771.1 copper homeostasis protein CutC [Testudinibacter sp. TR-2022]TNH16314.1 copper homeostasis protein CutC [Testudinibacter sp. TR-2022]TNH19240.1 copper homeostasis protein CutC [Testudinibacter sp. TR-2022]